MKDKKSLYIIDGCNLLYRYYYALPTFMTSRGEKVGALYGFTRMLLKLMTKPPDYWVIAWDSPKPNIRYTILPEYKANRPTTPSDYVSQSLLAKDLMDVFGVSWIEIDGQEADDIIASLTHKALKDNLQVSIFSGDKDLLQLLKKDVTIFLIKKGITELEEYTLERFLLEWGIYPVYLKDYKAIRGDPSDNIKGLEGFGEKTALELVKNYRNLEGLYENIDKLTPKQREIFLREKEKLFRFREVVSLNENINIDKPFSEMSYNPYEYNKVRDFFIKLEFRSFLKELPGGEGGLFSNVSQRVKVVGENNLLANETGEFLLLVDYLLNNYTKMDVSQIHLGNPGNPTSVSLNDLLKSDLKRNLLEILKDNKIKVITNDLKSLIHFLDKNGFPIPSNVDDLSLLFYLDNPDQNVGVNFSPDVDYSILVKSLKTERLSPKLLDLYEKVELPLSYVLASMEKTGILLDRDLLEVSKKEANEKVRELTRKAAEVVGVPFNLGSSQQVAEVLFEKLKLPPSKKGKSGYSTDVEVLKSLQKANPIVPLIMEYREISKLISTYLEALPKFINPETNRIHTTYSMRGTTTGRLSSRDPNLQNIPTRTTLGGIIRSAFVSAPGKIFISGDYSQIELRILAHLSEEPRLIKAFSEREDIHAYTASLLFGNPISQVTKEERRRAKTVNFGLIYGMSDYGLSQELGISRAEAKEFITRYFAQMPKVKEYLEDSLRVSAQRGLTETIRGRRRYINDLNSNNSILKNQAIRAAINTPIQGSAADIIKEAMVNIWKLTKDKNEGNLILQVHDELLMEVQEDSLDFWADLLKHNLEKVVTLKVPIEANISFGYNWRDLQPWKN